MGTENVKLGVCNALLGGKNLGLTKGGVNVEVTTDTHPTTVDQFGESEINESITKRSLKVTMPLAETTLENMVRSMPGATLIDNGTKQVYTISYGAVGNSEVYTVTVVNSVYSFTSDADATAAEIAAGLANVINLDSNGHFDAAEVSGDLVLTARTSGASVSVSYTGTAATGLETVAGVEGSKRVDVTNAVGTNLLSIAQQLVLHPQDLAADDKSNDFVVYKAATAGGLQFAYKADEERIFNVVFTGYPDGTNGNKLFSYGDLTA